MTAPERRAGRPPQITREQVVEAATRLGPAGLTVQAVADDLGVTRAAIYHYVNDVDELRRIAAYAGITPFGALADEKRTWQDWLRDFARATRDWRLAHGEPFLVLSLDQPDAHQFLVIVNRAIEVLIEAGFSPPEARHAFKFLIGVVWINAQDELTTRLSPPRERPPLRHVPQGGTGLPELPHIHVSREDPWFGDPTERFEQELDWVISALEHDLADSR